MALKVWLPLNKETETQNKGLLGDLGITTSPTFIDNGKIGPKCMSAGSYYMTAEQTANCLNNDTISFAFWLYLPYTSSVSSNIMLFGNNNPRKFAIFLWPTIDTIHLSWSQAGNNIVNTTVLYNDSNGRANNVLPLSQWTHVAVTYSSATTNVTIYVDGEVVKEWTNVDPFTISDFAVLTNLMTTSSNVYINDYRIYNHCLSLKEVKEISQALVLHYPLSGIDLFTTHDGSAIPHKNLFRTTCNSVTTCAYSSSGIHLVTPSSGNTNNGFIFYTFDWANVGLKYGDVVTFSVEVKGSASNSPFIDIIYHESNNSYSFWYTSGLVHSSKTFTPTSEYLEVTTSLTFPSTKGGDYRTLGFKVSGGVTSDLYINNIHAYVLSTADTSGYGNDGTITGNLTNFSDTPKYDLSSYFTNSYIKVPIYINYEMTFSIWIKNCSTTKHVLDARAVVDGSVIGYLPLYIKSNTVLQTGNSDYGYPDTTVPDISSGWHLITIIYTSNKSKLYTDGVLRSTYASIPGVTKGLMNLYIGSRYNLGNYLTGYLSDLRVYNTELSSEEIQDLYKTSACIDDFLNIECFEIKEDSSSSISANGIVQSDMVGELRQIPLCYERTTAFTPTAGITNSNCLFARFKTSDCIVGETYVIEFDIKWSGLTSDGTNTLYIGTNWSCVMNNNGSTNWSTLSCLFGIGTNAISGESGFLHMKCTFVPIAAAMDYDMYMFGIRINYCASGASILYLNMVVYKQDSIEAAIGNDFITGNQLIEI